MSSKFHSWLDLNLTALEESKSLRRSESKRVSMDHGLCLTNTVFFLAPEQHIIVITGLCHSPHALRTDIGGQMDTGGAGGREALGSLVSSQLRWHYSLFSRRKLSSKQGHWCLETFSQKSFDRTQSIQDGLSSHKLLKTNIENRRNIVVITEIIKIKKAKKITTKAPAVWNFLPDPTLVRTMKYAFKLKSPWHL